MDNDKNVSGVDFIASSLIAREIEENTGRIERSYQR